jgi:hypothetical protein
MHPFIAKYTPEYLQLRDIIIFHRYHKRNKLINLQNVFIHGKELFGTFNYYAFCKYILLSSI